MLQGLTFDDSIMINKNNIIIYWLIAKATISENVQLLNLCREPEHQQHLYITYVSDVIGRLYQIART